MSEKNEIIPTMRFGATIYVDFDGTLAYYDGWKGPENLGTPIPAMIGRVNGWIKEGKRVKIVTARFPEHHCYIREWLVKHGIGGLEVTNVKGIDGVEYWDDRAVAVAPNTGIAIRATEVEEVFRTLSKMTELEAENEMLLDELNTLKGILDVSADDNLIDVVTDLVCENKDLKNNDLQTRRDECYERQVAKLEERITDLIKQNEQIARPKPKTDNIEALAKKLRVAFYERKTSTPFMAPWDDICDTAKQSWIRVAQVADETLYIHPGDNTIAALQSRAHETAQTKGWHDDPKPSFGDYMANIHGEVSEVWEAYRDDCNFTHIEIDENGKPDGIPTELADIVIRVMDLCGEYGIDLQDAIARKMDFNNTREYRHGGKRA